jgi:hypothetical protein
LLFGKLFFGRIVKNFLRFIEHERFKIARFGPDTQRFLRKSPEVGFPQGYAQ